jgi:glycosyltransferase involved in cell wall biosynthesis
MKPEPTSLTTAFPRAAIAHEWLTIPGGSEKVVVELLDMLPEAEVFTSVYDAETWRETLAGRTVHASFLDRIPGARRSYSKLLPLMNAAFESFDLSDFDLVVSSSHSCAKNVLTRPGTLHVCYCHTPMRHAWEPRFLANEPLSAPAALAARLLLGRLRRDDLAGASRPDLYVANSRHVKARIAKYYRRDARVIHPPVEVDVHLRRPRDPGDYYLVLGRVVPYKRVDLAVAACSMLRRPVKVAGTGRAIDAARAAAGPGSEFLGYVPDDELGGVLAGARALLFPGEEDFGIVPVEAQAAGVPVIAYGEGGVRDTVVENETGVFHAEQTVTSVASAILQFESMQFDEYRIRANARRFGPARFRAEISDVLLEHAPERAAR